MEENTFIYYCYTFKNLYIHELFYGGKKNSFVELEMNRSPLAGTTAGGTQRSVYHTACQLHIAAPWNTAWSLSGVVGVVNEKQFSIREVNSHLDRG